MDISHYERQFYRLMVSTEDCHEAITYLDAIGESTLDVLSQAAILAAVIAYCRPFFGSRPGKENQSTSKVGSGLVKILSSEEMSLHKKLINYRKSALAHSDFDCRPAKITNEGASGWGYITTPAELYLDDIPLDQFKKLAVKIWKESRIKANDIKKEMDGLNPSAVDDSHD